MILIAIPPTHANYASCICYEYRPVAMIIISISIEIMHSVTARANYFVNKLCDKEVCIIVLTMHMDGVDN